MIHLLRHARRSRYFRHGGILQYVLRQTMKAAEAQEWAMRHGTVGLAVDDVGVINGDPAPTSQRRLGGPLNGSDAITGL